MYVVLERNHIFLNLKLGMLSTRNTGDRFRSHLIACPQRYPLWCLHRGAPIDQPCPTHRSKVRVKIEIKIEEVLLWSVIHAIRVGTESMLWLFVGLR